MEQQIEIRNPWLNSKNQESKPAYTFNAKPIFEYRGVAVFKRPQGWLYVLNDMALTERAGFSKDRAPEIIDSILDGRTPVADPVAEHISAHGFKGLSYTAALPA